MRYTGKDGQKALLHTGPGVTIGEQDIVLYFDGVELHRRKTPGSVKRPLFPLVNLALGSGWPTDKTPNPSYLYVDYVKVWHKKITGDRGMPSREEER